MSNGTLLSDQELEENYNFGSRIDSKESYYAEWIEKSTEARKRMTYVSDIRYGSEDRQTMDLFPAEDPNAPFMLFIHGGYWQAMVKENFSFVAETFVKAGISVGLVSYRLCPNVRVMDCIQDVVKCVSKLPVLLEKEGLNPKSYSVSGHSAGGNMTGWVVGSALQTGSDLPNMATGIGISGIYEVWPLVPTTVNGQLGMDMEEARACSPAVQNWNWSKANMILTSGGDESPDLLRQQSDFKDKIVADGGKAVECNAAGRHHFDVLYDFCDPEHELFKKSLALIKSA